MNLDYYTTYKTRDMLREAAQRRLAHAAQQKPMQISVLNTLGEQLIRLGESLKRTPPPVQNVPEMECCPA